MLIRPALPEDSELVVTLLHRSIIELCEIDHKSDPAALNSWLRNKTSAGYSGWLTNDQLIKFVVERAEAIVGFGMATTEGEILLNYVSPDFRFIGVSSLILKNIEQTLIDIGIKEAKLWSTETAHAFYQSKGWIDLGKPEFENGMTSYPMSKSLG